MTSSHAVPVAAAVAVEAGAEDLEEAGLAQVAGTEAAEEWAVRRPWGAEAAWVYAPAQDSQEAGPVLAEQLDLAAAAVWRDRRAVLAEQVSQPAPGLRPVN